MENSHGLSAPSFSVHFEESIQERRKPVSKELPEKKLSLTHIDIKGLR